MVWSRDEATGEEGFQIVVETYIRETDELVHLTYATEGTGAPSASDGLAAEQSWTLGGSSATGTTATLTGTAEHPFWSLTQAKWVELGKLEVGELLSLSTGTATVTALRVEMLAEPVKVYNFQVAQTHTYFAAPTATDPFVWVHNANYRSRLPKSVDEGGKSQGSWEGARGNSKWQSTDPDVIRATGDGSVQFRNGYPVFDRVGEVRFKKGELTGLDSDFGLADARYAAQLGGNWTPQMVKAFRQGEINGTKYTWHHHQNKRYMQLVPTDLHDNIPHIGGASKLRLRGRR